MKNASGSRYKVYGWGLFCVLSSIVVWHLTAQAKVHPSSRFGGITFFAQAVEGATLTILDAPKRFSILLSDGQRVTYAPDKADSQPFPFKVLTQDNSLEIAGLRLLLSEAAFKKMWPRGARYTPKGNDIGTVRYSLMARMQTVDGVYNVRNNVITGHFFEQRQPLFAISYACFAFFIYGATLLLKKIDRVVPTKPPAEHQVPVKKPLPVDNDICPECGEKNDSELIRCICGYEFPNR